MPVCRSSKASPNSAGGDICVAATFTALMLAARAIDWFICTITILTAACIADIALPMAVMQAMAILNAPIIEMIPGIFGRIYAAEALLYPGATAYAGGGVADHR